MGLLDKAVGLTKKVAEAGVSAASKKINQAKLSRAEEEKKLIDEFPYKYRYIIRQKDSTSVDLLLWEVMERDSYVVFNADEEPVYIAKGTSLMGKNHFVITNPSKYEVGRIKKALVNIPFPMMKERRSCSIEISGEPTFGMETYESFKEREYHFSCSDMTITADSKEKEFIVYGKKGRKEKEIVAHIYKMRSEEWGNDKYFVGFNEEKHMLKAISISIGIDLIRFSD